MDGIIPFFGYTLWLLTCIVTGPRNTKDWALCGASYGMLHHIAPPMASQDSVTHKPHSNDRYAFGYARDNSTFPVFLLHPARRQRETFTLVTLYTGATLPLDATPEICILSLEHFYDSFRAAPMTSLRSVVLAKYGLMPDMLTHDLRVSQQTAAALCRPDVRDIVPGDADEESEEDPVSGPSEHTPRDVRDPDGDVAMSQGSWTSSEGTSAVASDADDGEQDHELFLEAYSSFKTQSCLFDSQKGLQDSRNGLMVWKGYLTRGLWLGFPLPWTGLLCKLKKLQ